MHTYSGYENTVKATIEKTVETRQLQDIIHLVSIPMETVTEITDNGPKTYERKVFPGYVLVRMDLYDADGIVDEKAWYFVRSVQGVLGFLGDATRPTPLTEQEFLDMNPALNEESAAPVLVIGVKIGDIVRIKDGAFMGYEGNVTAIDETRGRLTVVILIFGRSTPVELEFWQVEPAV